MKVILKQDVKGVGKKDSLVDVSDGYARNFLLPKKLAVEANVSSMNELNLKKDAQQHKKDTELANAKDLATKLEQTTVVFKVKAGEQGKLFGSITGKDISEKLQKDFKLNVDKKGIVLEEPIKVMGTTSVEIRVYPGVHAKLNIKVEHE